MPPIEKAEDEAMFLTHAEFSLIMEGMGERYKAFRTVTLRATRSSHWICPGCRLSFSGRFWT